MKCIDGECRMLYGVMVNGVMVGVVNELDAWRIRVLSLDIAPLLTKPQHEELLIGHEVTDPLAAKVLLHVRT